MQKGDCFQFPRELLQWVVDRIILDHKQPQAASQLCHPHLQPDDILQVRNYHEEQSKNICLEHITYSSPTYNYSKLLLNFMGHCISISLKFFQIYEKSP